MGLKHFLNEGRKLRINNEYIEMSKKDICHDVILVETRRDNITNADIQNLLEIRQELPFDEASNIYFAINKGDSKHLNRENVEYVIRGTERYIECLATARYIMAEDYLPTFFVKRKGQVVYFIGADIKERRPGRSNLDEAKYISNIQKTLLDSDAIICTNDKQDIYREYFLNNAVNEEGTFLYVGNVSDGSVGALAQKLINDLKEKNTILCVGIESEIDFNTRKFVANLPKEVDAYFVPDGGNITFMETMLLKLYSLTGRKLIGLDRYFKQEYDRLLSSVRCSSIEMLTTEKLERMHFPAFCEKNTLLHKVSLAFQDRVGTAIYSNPKLQDKIGKEFNRVIDYPKNYGIEIWGANNSNGLYASIENIHINCTTEKVFLNANIVIKTDEENAELMPRLTMQSKTYENSFSYDMNIRKLWSKRKNELFFTKYSISAGFSNQEVLGWFSTNILYAEINYCDTILRCPLRAIRKKSALSKKVFSINGTNEVIEIKDMFRYLRLVVKQQHITDKNNEKFKLLLAWLLATITPHKKCILMYEKLCHGYEESASILFQELVNLGYKNVRYILNSSEIEKNSIERKYCKYILPQFSFRHYYYLFAAKTIISSEALGHALEKGCNNSLFTNFIMEGSKNYVFLQHGVYYMVSMNSEQRKFFNKRPGKGKQRVVVSSQLEAVEFIENAKYDKEDIYNTGLIKFDKAIMNPDADKIMVMLTWRPWEEVIGLSNINNTSYYQMLKRIVNSIPEELKEKLIVMPHPLLANQAQKEPSDVVWSHYLPGAKYDDLLKQTKVLITDYSSISYDAFYRGANIIFDWEEKDECICQYGENSKLLLTEELAFGDVVYDSKEIGEIITDIYNSDQKEAFIENYRQLVEFHDNKNTQRFIEAAKADKII